MSQGGELVEAILHEACAVDLTAANDVDMDSGAIAYADSVAVGQSMDSSQDDVMGQAQVGSENLSGIFGSPTIVLAVTATQPEESIDAFRALDSTGLTFAVEQAANQRVRAYWGGRVFEGAHEIDQLAESLRAFQRRIADLGPVEGDPLILQRAQDHYRTQRCKAAKMLDQIVAHAVP